MERNLKFSMAGEKDKQEILYLYRKAIGTEGCTWSMDYPNEKILDGDFTRNALFVLKNDEEIIGAISIDDDKVVEQLPCWEADLQPGAELARLVVKESCQNRGVARFLLQSVMEELRRMKYQSVHFLVSKTNYRAINSYAKLCFDRKGEAELFGEHWWCYEKKL